MYLASSSSSFGRNADRAQIGFAPDAPHAHTARRDPDPARSIGSRDVGCIGVEIVRFAAGAALHFNANTSTVCLVAPIVGILTTTNSDGAHVIDPDAAFLQARRERARCCASASGEAIVLHIPRKAIQTAAAAVFGTPRRLGGVSVILTREMADGFFAVLKLLADDKDPAHAAISESRLLDALIKGLRGSASERDTFPLSRSVQRVLDHIRTDPLQDMSDQELTKIAGITIASLRRNFRDCLGMPIAGVVRGARLDWAHERMTSGKETRSITDFARALGFARSGAFTRAYQRRFAETPSQTRGRAAGNSRARSPKAKKTPI